MDKVLNPFEEFPVIRQWAYRVYWVAVLVTGAIQVGFLTQTGEVPVWTLTIIAVLGYLGAFLNFQADRNTGLAMKAKAAAPQPVDDSGDGSDEVLP